MGKSKTRKRAPHAEPSIPSLEERERAARAERLKETMQVAAQPHRRGDGGDMTDAFGTFIKMNFTMRNQQRACFQAGQYYILLVAKWRKVKGVRQRSIIEEEGIHGGGEIDEDTVEKWGNRIRECENAMKCSGLSGFHAANDLVLEDIAPRFDLHGPVQRAILQLAICLGTI